MEFGISLVALLAFATLYRDQISPDATTSDVCHRLLKPLTTPAGWKCVPTVTNAEKGWYKHEYVEEATGRRQDAPPPGTTSYCEVKQPAPYTKSPAGRTR
jgi:hypothetical protein